MTEQSNADDNVVAKEKWKKSADSCQRALRLRCVKEEAEAPVTGGVTLCKGKIHTVVQY